MKFLDLQAEYQEIKDEIDAAIARVLTSGTFILGPEVSEFEREVVDFVGTRHAVGVASGTDALVLALRALDIGEEDEVIVPPFTFIATASAVRLVDAKPVFVDIKSDTFTIDPDAIEHSITTKTRAIIPVHLYGQMADMKRIMEIAKHHHLFVIEDAAQAFGARQIFDNQQRMAGSIGDIGCFSFFPTKVLGAYGDGGMVVTANGELASKIRKMRIHGQASEKYFHDILGVNSRLDALQAAILRVKLRFVKSRDEKRRQIASRYRQLLADIPIIETPITLPGNTHVWHQYTIRVKERDELRAFLQENGIPTMIYYPSPLHLQQVFSYLGYTSGAFPKAERASREVLSLPIYPTLRERDIETVTSHIHAFFQT